MTSSEHESTLKKLTHLILDEVHEREHSTDLLLIAIRDGLKIHRHLKLILMSATLNARKFCEYFDNCPVLSIPGRSFDVQVMHLGDVLYATSYMTSPEKEDLMKIPLKERKMDDNVASKQEGEYFLCIFLFMHSHSSNNSI